MGFRNNSNCVNCGIKSTHFERFFFQNKWMFSIPVHFENKIVDDFVQIGVLQVKSFQYTYTCNTLEQIKVLIFGFRFYAL